MFRAAQFCLSIYTTHSLDGKDKIILRVSVWLAGRNKCGPSHPGLRRALGRMSRNRRHTDEVAALRALKLPTSMDLGHLQVLVAVRTGKFDFVHGNVLLSINTNEML